ncbi:unnamed protein product [Symbiodinium natans]|uniref:Uncharacterized protein n=1 Tax=Symbiodinium natans TaxID=878477 RepID=A0A812G3U7_9DINO|nr:unnamed protein product [Symbiodinium natans]
MWEQAGEWQNRSTRRQGTRRVLAYRACSPQTTLAQICAKCAASRSRLAQTYEGRQKQLQTFTYGVFHKNEAKENFLLQHDWPVATSMKSPCLNYPELLSTYGVNGKARCTHESQPEHQQCHGQVDSP